MNRTIRSRNPVKNLLKNLLLLMGVAFCSMLSQVSFSGDWPMWRYDEGRTASSPHDLPDNLGLIWSRSWDQREMVWDDPLNHDLMPYDRVFEPVVSGKTMIIGFNDSDKIIALDTETGNEKWAYHTDGPVRMPPVIWKNHVLTTSDDGFLYCLNIKDGSLTWKLRGGPRETRVLGNKRLISMWPARGGAVVRDGVVYWSAGIWPFMGIFIYAVEIESGRIVWANDGTGATYMLQPHSGAYSFGGVAPQGAFVISCDKLVIPGGRSVPAVFDLKTGEYLYYHLNLYNKTGGSFVCATSDLFFNHSRDRMTNLYESSTGMRLISNIGIYPVIDGGNWYLPGDKILAVRGQALEEGIVSWRKDSTIESSDWPKLASASFRKNILWEKDINSYGDLIKAGDRIYSASGGTITALRTGASSSMVSIAWKKSVRGNIERLIAADDKLFAVTLEGTVYAFGKPGISPRIHTKPVAVTEPNPSDTRRALEIFYISGVREGYALIYGTVDGKLIEALLAHSSLHIIAVDSNLRNVEKMRREFDMKGLYGKRVAVHHGTPEDFDFPKYIASLTIVSDSLQPASAERTINKILDSARPYDGAVLLGTRSGEFNRLKGLAESSGIGGIEVSQRGAYTACFRKGPLPGAGEWTHNNADIANTAKSDDSLVKLPLGILWFGGNSNMDVLPRHGHGPGEMISKGRLFIQGIDCLSARDVYTGRVLWKRELHGLNTFGVYYDETYSNQPTSTAYNQIHLPGANIRGANMAITSDRVYIIQGRDCHVLDTVTGRTLSVISIAPDWKAPSSGIRPPGWGYIGVYKNYLFGGREFVPYSELAGLGKAEYNPRQDTDFSASRSLVAMDRITGEKLWEIESRYGFIHNGISVGNGMLFCIDRAPPSIEAHLSRRGISHEANYRLLALDAATGEILWSSETDIFGTYLSYSEKYDYLVFSTRPSRDMVSGESGNKLRVFRAKDGSVVWEKNYRYSTFPILHNDLIITESGALVLGTGEPVMRTSPITGEQSVWDWKRYYGCNYPVASEHMLTFRSGAAGYLDLLKDSGTGNFGGFKSGCSANLLAADGVLNAPDYTRTCSCSYQNQTSLALVHMPGMDIENWSFNTEKWDGKPVKRVGINFGAPGDFMSQAGTLWLDYPSVGGDSPDVPLEVSEKTEWYRYHSSRISQGDLKPVSASGGRGLERFTITISEQETPVKPYTVRLYFAEPEHRKAGERVFDIIIQGKQQYAALDISGESGSHLRELVKEFRSIPASRTIEVQLVSRAGIPVISGIELIQE